MKKLIVAHVCFDLVTSQMSNAHCEKMSELPELIEFLKPHSRFDLRCMALSHVLGE